MPGTVVGDQSSLVGVKPCLSEGLELTGTGARSPFCHFIHDRNSGDAFD
jgi:hypothetical protein